MKLLFIALLVLLLQAPLYLINTLLEERQGNNVAVATRTRFGDTTAPGTSVVPASPNALTVPTGAPARSSTATAATAALAAAPLRAPVFEAYRMVNRALKHSALVLSLVFAGFFLFEAVAGVRLHAVHYGLVGAAMCLFYLALLALGEVVAPGAAYIGAAGASSLLIVAYSASILRSWLRATAIAALLAGVHGVLYIVLRMEFYALLAGTSALFVALGAVMFFTRNIDWRAQDAGSARALNDTGADARARA